MTLGKSYATLDLSLHIDSQGSIWLTAITSALGSWDSTGLQRESSSCLWQSKTEQGKNSCLQGSPKQPLCTSRSGGTGLGREEESRV